MADNVILPGAGVSVSSDEVGGVQIQRVKIDQGAEGSTATSPAHNAADTGNPLKVGGKFNVVSPTLDDGDRSDMQVDVNGNVKVTLATGIAGENWTVNRLFTENNYSYSRKTADGQVLGAAGYLHTITIAPTTATPTAGLVTVYDNTAASGTVIYTEWVFATTPGHTVTIDANCATGIYVDYDATLANVSVTASYRTNV